MNDRMMEPMEWEQRALAAGADVADVWRRRDVEERLQDAAEVLRDVVDALTQRICEHLEYQEPGGLDEPVSGTVPALNDWSAICVEAMKVLRDDLQLPRGVRDDVDELRVDVRTYNLLRARGINTLSELIQHSPGQIRAIDGIGHFRLHKLELALRELGLSLAREAVR